MNAAKDCTLQEKLLRCAMALILAAGAMLAFCADRLTTLSELGGIRLRYGPVWVSAFTVLGWFLMILGAWLMAMPAV